MNVLRWLVTALCLTLVAGTGLVTARRLAGARLRIQADRQLQTGDLLASLETYDRARRWDPVAIAAYLDPAEATVLALSRGLEPSGEVPPHVLALATRGLELFVASVAEAPTTSRSWGGIARVYEKLRQTRPAPADPDTASRTADAAQELWPEDRLAEAALLRALRHDPANDVYLDNLGEFYWDRGLHDRALVPFRQAVAAHPVLASHSYVVAGAGRSAALADAVIQGLLEARERVPDEERWIVARERGYLERLRGRLHEASGYYAVAIEESMRASERDRAGLHLDLAEAQEQMGEMDAAVESLRQAIRLQPRHAPSRGRLGTLLGRLGRHQEAMAALGEARELEPSDPALARLMAEELGRVGDLDRAERAYQDLIRLQPELVEPYVQVIDLLRAAGQSPRAIPYARELVHRHPGDRVYRVLLEQLYEDEVHP